MILITGGVGFIGSHTTRAFLDLGQPCVLVRRRAPEPPELLRSEVGRRVFLEQADINDLPSLLAVGTRVPRHRDRAFGRFHAVAARR